MSSSPGRSTAPPRIALLRADAEFLHAVPEAEREQAAGLVHAARVERRAGTVCTDPDDLTGCPDCVAAIVLEGLLVREVTLAGRSTLELYGPGDVFDGEPADLQVSWRVQDPVVLAVLDERFVAASRRWPGLWQVLLRRSQLRASRLSAHLAALQLSRVEQRIVAVLWQLAERWGRVTSDGVVIPVALTHELLGRFVGARRSTVSLGLAQLADDGLVRRRQDGAWLVSPASRDVLAGAEPEPLPAD